MLRTRDLTMPVVLGENLLGRLRTARRVRHTVRRRWAPRRCFFRSAYAKSITSREAVLKFDHFGLQIFVEQAGDDLHEHVALENDRDVRSARDDRKFRRNMGRTRSASPSIRSVGDLMPKIDSGGKSLSPRSIAVFFAKSREKSSGRGAMRKYSSCHIEPCIISGFISPSPSIRPGCIPSSR